MGIVYKTLHSSKTISADSASASLVFGQQPQCEIDPQFFQDGGIVCSRDLAFLLQQYETFALDASPQVDSTRLAGVQQTIRVILAARSSYPEATLFRCGVSGGSLSLTPYDWSAPNRPNLKYTSDVVVIGAELPSLTTAIQAADQGFSVTVVYAGPLGGICADDGANLRFFDYIQPTSHPESQVKLFEDALGMKGFVDIPLDTQSRLQRYFDIHYAGKIHFVKTHSYDSLNVDLDGSRLADVQTAEGVRVSGQYFVDTDPDSRVAEKCHIPMDINTPDLSYGVVFDISGLNEVDYGRLTSHELIAPDVLMSMTGVTLDQVKANHQAYMSYHLLEQDLSHEYVFVGQGYRFGYNALAQGFDFMMRCRGLADPTDAGLAWLNSHRDMSGFNISEYGDTGNFNSISYYFPQSIMQYSHNLAFDPIFEPIRSIDLPAMDEYIKYVTGDLALTLRAPNELYVRKSTAFFKLLHPYSSGEFNGPVSTKYYTYYAMDLRGLRKRDPIGWPIVLRDTQIARGKHFWGCRASATETEIGNLFLVNKDGVTPAFSGGQRILGNQINMGAALVDALPRTIGKVGSKPEFVKISGTVGKTDIASNTLVVAARTYAEFDSAQIPLNPPRDKQVAILTPAKLDSLGRSESRMQVSTLHDGEPLEIEGWDHGIGSELWATHIQTGL